MWPTGPDFPFFSSSFPTQPCYHGYIHRHCPATSTSLACCRFFNPAPKAMVASGQMYAYSCPVVTMTPPAQKLQGPLRACWHGCQPVEGSGPVSSDPITLSSGNLPPTHTPDNPEACPLRAGSSVDKEGVSMSAHSSLPGALLAPQRWIYEVLCLTAQPRNDMPCQTVMSWLGLPGSWYVRPRDAERWASCRKAPV